MNPAALVDVIIPIHDSARPLERALNSLMTSKLSVGREVAVNVVCHNINASEIIATLPPSLRGLVNFLELHDNLPSPAGPRIHALRNTHGRYIAFLDSDDYFEAGALDDWVSRAERFVLDAVVPPERHSTGVRIRTPVVRPFRNGELDPIRDRLSYRTAPLGLIRRATIDRLELEPALGVRNGSDQIFALKLWFDDTTLRFARGGPAYVVGDDAPTRVTRQAQPLAAEMKATTDIFDTDWFMSLPLKSRQAIIVKFVRVQLFGSISQRLSGEIWGPADLHDARGFLHIASTVAPGYQRSLAIADVRLCTAIENDQTSNEVLARLSQQRRRFGHPATLMTDSLRALLMPDAPIRFMLASLLL